MTRRRDRGRKVRRGEEVKKEEKILKILSSIDFPTHDSI